MPKSPLQAGGGAAAGELKEGVLAAAEIDTQERVLLVGFGSRSWARSRDRNDGLTLFGESDLIGCKDPESEIVTDFESSDIRRLPATILSDGERNRISNSIVGLNRLDFLFDELVKLTDENLSIADIRDRTLRNSLFKYIADTPLLSRMLNELTVIKGNSDLDFDTQAQKYMAKKKEITAAIRNLFGKFPGVELPRKSRYVISEDDFISGRYTFEPPCGRFEVYRIIQPAGINGDTPEILASVLLRVNDPDDVKSLVPIEVDNSDSEVAIDKLVSINFAFFECRQQESAEHLLAGKDIELLVESSPFDPLSCRRDVLWPQLQAIIKNSLVKSYGYSADDSLVAWWVVKINEAFIRPGPPFCNEVVFSGYIENDSVSSITIIFSVVKFVRPPTTAVTADPADINQRLEEAIRREERPRGRPPSLEQMAVTDALLKRTKECLGLFDLSVRYVDVRYLILTPRFVTLQEQTWQRLYDAGLAREGEQMKDLVLQYDKSSFPSYNKFMKSARENENILHVIIADECHYAPVLSNAKNEDAAHNYIVNSHLKSSLAGGGSANAGAVGDEDLFEGPENVFTLLVSATPENCLTSNTRVKKQNVVVWNDVVKNITIPSSEAHVSDYRGLDDCLLSIGFRIDRLCAYIHWRTNNADAKTGRIELDSNRRFIDYFDLAEYLNDKVRKSCSLDRDVFKFTKDTGFRILPSPIELIWPEDGLTVLAHIGFQQSQFQAPLKTAALKATREPDVDSDQVLCLQRIRRDLSFDYLLEKFLSEFRGAATKGATSLTIGWKLNKKTKERKDIFATPGHFIVVDYLFDLTYFGLFRVNKAGWFVAGKDMLLPFGDPDEIFTADSVEEFRRMLNRVVVIGGTDDFHAYNNVQKISDFILRCRIDEARSEIIKSSSDDILESDVLDCDCLVYIFKQMYNAEQKDHVTTEEESWFTETSRNVRTLFSCDANTERGSMILLRIEETDGNLFFQSAMRKALEILGLVSGNGRRPFSVLSDIGTTKIIEHIEPCFKTLVLRDDGSTLETLSSSKSTSKRSLDYIDLQNLPCLVILCERGRMGDTFPHSFSTFDLRIRTSNNHSTLVQELGRMCRYPSATLFMSGVQDLASLQNHVKFGELREQLQKKKRSVIIRDSDGKTLLHVHTQKDLHDYLIFNQDKVAASGGVDLYLYDYPLPCAVLKNQSINSILDASMNYEKAKAVGFFGNSSRWGNPLDYLQASSLDEYVIKDPKAPQKNSLNKYAPLPIEAYRAKDKHYDYGNKRKDPRRVLLSANCQVGKTGVYLHFLDRLLSEVGVESVRIDEEESVNGDENEASRTFFDRLFPYWEKLAHAPPLSYSKVAAGKYFLSMINQRMQLLVMSIKEGGASWSDAYCKKLLSPDPYCELVTSRRGQALLAAFSDRNKHAPEPLTWEGDIEVPLTKGSIIRVKDREVLTDALNWDKRLDNPGPLGLSQKTVLTDFLDLNVKQDGTMRVQGKDVQGGVWPSPTDASNGDHLNPTFTKDIDRFAFKRFQSPFSSGSSVVSGSILHDARGDPSLRWRFQSYPRFSYPKHSKDLFEFAQGNEAGSDVIIGACCSGKAAAELRVRWIFTPSYGRSEPGRGQAYLDRAGGMGLEPNQYVQVLVVRRNEGGSGGTEFDNYRKAYGGAYVILELPKELEVNYGLDGNDRWVTVKETSGIGYARCVSQIVAYCLGLDAIWFIDDNATNCFALSLPDDKPTPCTFATMMMDLEELLETSPSTKLAVEGRRLVVNEEKPFYNFDFSTATEGKIAAPSEGMLRGMNKAGKAADARSVTNLAEYSGSPGQFGIIGISRGIPQIWNTKNPHYVTHSVYSCYLLNVKATVERGVIYPAKTSWEDIEFIHMVDESGLVVLKINRFLHQKKNLSTHINKKDKSQSEDDSSFKGVREHIIRDLPPFKSEALLEECHVEPKQHWVKRGHIVEEDAAECMVYLVEGPRGLPLELIIDNKVLFLKEGAASKGITKVVCIGQTKCCIPEESFFLRGGWRKRTTRYPSIYWAYETDIKNPSISDVDRENGNRVTTPPPPPPPVIPGDSDMDAVAQGFGSMTIPAGGDNKVSSASEKPTSPNNVNDDRVETPPKTPPRGGAEEDDELQWNHLMRELATAKGAPTPGAVKQWANTVDDVNYADVNGDTAMMLAARKLNSAVPIKVLVGEFHAHIEPINQKNETALFIAAKEGNENAVEALLQLGARVFLSGKSALVNAASGGHLGAVKHLIDDTTMRKGIERLASNEHALREAACKVMEVRALPKPKPVLLSVLRLLVETMRSAGFSVDEFYNVKGGIPPGISGPVTPATAERLVADSGPTQSPPGLVGQQLFYSPDKHG